MMDERDLFELIRSRRAIRRFQAVPVPENHIIKLLEAAMWSPSAHNRQPWRFAVLTQFERKKDLAEAMGHHLRLDRLKDGDPVADIELDVARSIARITGAPLIIAVFLTMSPMDRYPDERRNEAERVMAVQSTAMAAQNLWLMAHALGLGACWLCAPLFVPELVRSTLDLPEDWEAQGLFTIGWPAEEKEKIRRPWQENTHFLE